jgi:hydrogenase/urease accessory protein HupE
MLVPGVQAHPEGFSGLRVSIDSDAAHSVITLHTRDLTAWFPPAKYSDYIAQVCDKLGSEPTELLEITVDEHVLAASNARASSPQTGMIQVDLDYPLPRGARSIQIWSKHLPLLPAGHQQLRTVTHRPDVLLEDTLSVDHDSATIEFPATVAATSSPPPRSNTSFFLLGIEHFVTGYDHVLFLAALLLVCTSFRQAASVITFFTVAHSITLSLAALDLVRIPTRLVEPAIAASIVYVGLENILGRHRLIWRAAITFGFGLIHGLGFASALREIGLGQAGTGVALPLLKFSIGLETGQLCIAAIMLQLLLALRRAKAAPQEPPWVPAGSMLVALIGAYWFVARVIAG